MVTLTRTWAVSLNNVPASQATLQLQASNILLAYKNMKVAAGWTVEHSSNSVTASPGDNVTTAANFVWNTNAAAHSWMILKSPANTPTTGVFMRELIACSTGASSQHQVSITVSTQAFTANLTSTSTNPTAPSGFRTFATKQFLNATLTNVKYHHGYTTLGDSYFIISENGSGFCQAGWISASMVPAEAADLYPHFSGFGYSATSPGAFILGNLANIGNSWVPWIDGNVFSTDEALAGMAHYQGAGSATATDFFTLVDANGSDISGKQYNFPVYVICRTAPYIAIRGLLVDFFHATRGGLPQGYEEPNSGPTTTMVVGHMMIPNGGISPVFT